MAGRELHTRGVAEEKLRDDVLVLERCSAGLLSTSADFAMAYVSL